MMLIDNSGRIVSTFLITFLLGVTAHAPTVAGGAPSASFQSIPMLPGADPEGTAEAISADGSLVAGHNDSAGSQLFPLGPSREAWIYRPGEGTVGLGDLPGIPYGLYNTGSGLFSRDGSTLVGLSLRQETYYRIWYWRTSGSGMRPLDLLPGALRAVPTGLSGNGDRVIGWAEGPLGVVPFVWQRGGGVQPLFPASAGISGGTAAAISPDGASIVGHVQTGGSQRAFRWRSGAVELLPAPGAPASAVDVSADGAVVAGAVSVDGQSQAAVWQGGNQPILLGSLPGDIRSQALAVSDDGKRVLGISEEFSTRQRLFLWTVESGLTEIGSSIPGAFRYEVRSTAPDLSIAAGVVRLLGQEQPFTGFIWDRVRGLRDVKTVLRDEWGLTAETAGYEQLGVNGISADGRTFVGEAGIGPVSEQTPYIARLHETGRLVLPSAVKTPRGKSAALTISVEGNAPVAFEVSPASRGLSAPPIGAAYTLFPGEQLELPVQPAGRARSANLILTELRPGRPSHRVKIKFR